MKITDKAQITRYEDGQTADKEDIVIVESLLNIRVNGTVIKQILCTSTSLKELVTGFLFCEGMIHSADDVKEFKIDEEESVADVRLWAENVPSLTSDSALSVNEFVVSADYILEQVSQFSKKSGLFASTGSVHGCCLCDEKRVLFYEEDISRHNAVDKVIGCMLINKINPGNTFLLTSGRVPSDMCVKIVKCGVPILVSRSAPTDSAIAIAEKNNITLIGFARGARMNIYTGRQRIKL